MLYYDYILMSHLMLTQTSDPVLTCSTNLFLIPLMSHRWFFAPNSTQTGVFTYFAPFLLPFWLFQYSVLMHLLSLYQSCTNFMTLLNPRNCSTQHQPEEKTDKPSISKALCGWAGTWISIKQAIYINRCTRDLQHNSASSLIGQVLHYDVCCLCHTGRIHSLLMETTKQVVPSAANNGY